MRSRDLQSPVRSRHASQCYTRQSRSAPLHFFWRRRKRDWISRSFYTRDLRDFKGSSVVVHSLLVFSKGKRAFGLLNGAFDSGWWATMAYMQTQCLGLLCIQHLLMQLTGTFQCFSREKF